MGIQGLTSFINNRSDRYLEYYELYDTYLVIDGNSIACQLYSWYSKCNCAFGGDYDEFARCVSKFFDDLLKCNITPLVLIDGGSEDKKLSTIISRTKDKLRTAGTLVPDNRKTQRMKFFPLMMKEVFKDVMREKNIRYVQCLFEADNDIAAIARTLDCPVLSYDSDFYVYGTMYIPFDTMNSQLFRRPNGYMKRCKIYRVEYLLKSFPGLQKSMLPLAAILLGNDYVKHGTFKNFFQHVKLRGFSRKKHNQQQCRIEAVFVWLSKQTLDKAVIAILSRVRKQIRPKLLNILETNINGYTNSSIDILIPLGFSRDYVAKAKSHSVNTSFKFNGDLNSLSYIEETSDGENEQTSEEEEAEGRGEIRGILAKSEYESENALVKRLPAWFVKEFLEGRYPAYFIDLLVRCLYICPVQVEDHCTCSSIMGSVDIINVIYDLLKAGISGRPQSMKYMYRDEATGKLTCGKLISTDATYSCNLPSLFSLREISLARRKEIINNSLRIVNNEWMNELPPNWKLYIACVKYWIEQQILEDSQFFLYSVLICMLFNIIDYKIGMYRKVDTYENECGTTMQVIRTRRKADKFNPCYSMNVTVLQAYNEIDSDDCFLAAPFFVSHFEMDRKLASNPKKFERFTVHIFAELQNCLRHSMNLNALLDYPYPQIEIANLFNGTLLYNLYSNFESRHNIEAYINTVFHNAPTLLRLFKILAQKVTSLLPSDFKNHFINVKKRRKRSKRVKSYTKAVESDTEYFSPDDNMQEVIFYDVNNPYSLLCFR